MPDVSPSIQSFRERCQLPEPLELGNLPTPLTYHAAMSRDLGVKVWLKREDMADALGCGNKLRKLAYIVAEAERCGATTLLTVGSLPSNQCKAVAFVAALRGLKAQVIYGGDHQERPQTACGNYLLTTLLGASVVWCERRPWSAMAEELARVEGDLRGRGERPWVIPSGASVWPGLAGSIELGLELADQMAAVGCVPTAVVAPAGSGGTALGLFLAGRQLGLSWRVMGMCIGECAGQVHAAAEALQAEVEVAIGAGHAGGATLSFVNESRGAGYDQPSEIELVTMRNALGRYGLILDLNYMVKALLGLRGAVESGWIARGSHVVLVHTGGQIGVFDGNDALQQWHAHAHPGLVR